MLSYCVRCHFETASDETIERWLNWLRDGHIQDVMRGGATSGTIFKLDVETGSAYEIRYQFPDRKTFQTYEAQHAPALRNEGLELFPLSLGLSYSRSIGEKLTVIGG